MQAQYHKSVLLFHVAKNGSDIRFSFFMPYIIPHTPVAHLSMGGWLLGRPYLKEKILCRDPLAAEGLCFLFHRKVRSDTGGKAYNSIYFKRIIRNENNI